MGRPEKELKCIHVAGTNGKGSVTFITASILSTAGYRVGRFSSPHLHSYLERFTIDGQQIEAGQFKEYLDHIQYQVNSMTTAGQEHPTEFEVLTALAFQYFKDSKVDLAVIEVGLGGVYDSTNIISPLVSVITGVDYDHTAVLGNNLAEIAENKAGIIKPGIPVVAGAMSEEAWKVIRAKASIENAPCFDLDTIKVTLCGQPGMEGQDIDIDFVGQEIAGVHFGLVGVHQLDNLRLSLGIIHLLEKHSFIVPISDMVKALTHMKFPGRMEIVSRNPLVIVDAGHNPQAARALATSLNSILGERKKVLLCGYLDDKDAEAALSSLGVNASKCVVSRPEGERAKKWYRVAELWNKIYPGTECYMQEDIEIAVELGLQLLGDDEYLLITGSFYLLDRARQQFTNP
ncbi:dihydrofolate synthase / folylpolyglutamate synthase [hydrocarbon metagenome]|uniref:tetrahydrofolate synthase n=1 Tax=hydrocarbon metagenome TaxID=938273 RepID=A0A0W8E3F7_9ZZZZ